MSSTHPVIPFTPCRTEFVCVCIYQWSGDCGQNILDKETFSEGDLKKWEKHLEKLEAHCKPRGSRFVAATQYKVLTQGDLELPEYIENCRQITDACGLVDLNCSFFGLNFIPFIHSRFAMCFQFLEMLFPLLEITFGKSCFVENILTAISGPLINTHAYEFCPARGKGNHRVCR